MTARPTPKRVRAGHVAWLMERMSGRDWKILEAVNHFHLITGWQLDRLFFVDLAGRSRTVTRSRTLSRLVSWRVLARLPRRVGGSLRGSSVACYRVDSGGQRLLAIQANASSTPKLVRKANVPSERFVAHVVAVVELYVELVEAARAGALTLREFIAEPAAWWPNGLGNWLKPDAYFVISNGRTDFLFWAEVDRATESSEAIKRKLITYLDFVNRGQLGPRNAIPRVLITVPHESRKTLITRVVNRLPPPANELFVVSEDREALLRLLSYLRE